jgi:ribosomal protein S27AE
MAVVAMRPIRPGEVPPGGGTAVQEDPGRPVFRGNGADDYTCAECGNVLAVAMDPDYMDFKVRIRCGRCGTINVPDTDEAEDRARWKARMGR